MAEKQLVGMKHPLPIGETSVRVREGETACVIFGDYIAGIEHQRDDAKAALPKAVADAYRNAAALLEIQLKQARLEGLEIPSRLDICANRIRALADKQEAS